MWPLVCGLLALTLVPISASCPQSILALCKCLSTPAGLRIECADRSLDEVIRGIGQNARIEKLSILNTQRITTEIPAQVFGSAQIRELELSGNNILRMDENAFDGTAVHLVTLTLKDNSLERLPKMEAMTNLETLDISGNSITSIPDNLFANTKKLRRLHFRSNKICKLGPNSLNETKDRLEFLDFSSNCMDEIPAQNLRGAQKLQYLDLSGNRIKNVPSMRFMNLPSLVELRLNNNSMEELHPLAFMNVPNLEQLNLSDNKLTNVEVNQFQSFSRLTALDISRNQLTKIVSNTFQNVANLKQLILDDNRIESVETLAFSSLPALEMISFQNNGLQRLFRNAFDSLPLLTSLLFTNNSLDEIGEGTFSGMPALQQLILSDNRLIALQSGSFDTITQLTTLDLSNNILNTIGANVFQNLNKLFWLDLSGNQLNVLAKDTFSNKISNVLLQGNPLFCNESIDWLVQYLVSNNVRTFLPNQHDVRCAGPPEKRGTLLKDLMLQKANDTFFNNLHNSNSNPANSRLPNISSVDQPGVQTLPGGQSRPVDLLKYLPQLMELLRNSGGNIENIDISKVPPEVLGYVAQGGQIPGISKEQLQQITQRYMIQMAAKNGANSQSTASNIIPNPSIPVFPSPGPVFTLGPPLNPINKSIPFNISSILASGTLPPLDSIPPQLIQSVLNGSSIPGLTQEQTEAIKRRYMQQLYTPGAGTDTTTIGNIQSRTSNINNIDPITTHSPISQFSQSSFFNLTDLQSLNIDLSKIPPEVIRDLVAGRTPDFGKIPEDIIRIIMEKRPKLFGEIVSRELRTRIPSSSQNGSKFSTDSSLSVLDFIKKRPTYDVNDLDKKADISVLTQDSNSQQITIWTGVALGAIGAITIIAVAVLCWRRRVTRNQRRASRQTQVEDTSDTSQFFQQPKTSTSQNPERSKVKFDEPTSGPSALDLMFGTEQPNRGPPVDPRSGPIFSLDSNNRMNNHIYAFDPYRNVSGYQSPHPPPLPNHPPARQAVFDHNTGAWMFVQSNTNFT